MTPAQHKEYMSNYIKNQEGVGGSETEKEAGQEFLEEPVKRQKIREALGSGEESAEKEKELSEENKEIFSEEFYVKKFM
ncbi:hypothetical protein Tco_0204874 [Tanacetum coccineum]